MVYLNNSSCLFNDLHMALDLLSYRPVRTIMNMKSAMIVLGLVMVLEGCQSMQAPSVPASLDNAGFMTAYDVYRHCQAASDTDAMRADLQKLRLAAAKQESASSFSFSLPEFLTGMVEKPASRLAADPNAMAAACALSTGQAALIAERTDLAVEMFQSVLETHTQPEYAYYADQARIGLDQAEHAARFAGIPNGTPAALKISIVAPVSGGRLPVSTTD